jgi:hypothetical protein
VDQSLSKKTNYWFAAYLKIEFPNLSCQKKSIEPAHYHTTFKGKCLTGMAHYNPFVFSVNKKSITKNLHSVGKLKEKFSRKTCRVGRHSHGNSSCFFQYFAQYADSTKINLSQIFSIIWVFY